MQPSFQGFPSPRPDKKGGSGSNIKSLQSGSTAITAANITAAISSVNTNNSVIFHTEYPSGTVTNAGYEIFATSAFNSSTQIQFTRNGTTQSSTLNINYFVVEFNNVKSKQTGTVAISATATTVNISSVNTSKALLFFDYTDDANVTSQADKVLGKFNSSTQIEFDQSAVPAKTLNWTVIEFN